MPESRRHFRLRQHMDVRWNLNDAQISGEGEILNISFSGVFLQTDRVFQVSDQNVLSLSFKLEGQNTALTKQGKIVWFRPINAPQPRYQCGVEFIHNPDHDGQLNAWLETKVTELSEASDANILNNYIGQ